MSTSPPSSSARFFAASPLNSTEPSTRNTSEPGVCPAAANASTPGKISPSSLTRRVRRLLARSAAYSSGNGSNPGARSAAHSSSAAPTHTVADGNRR